MQYCMLKHAVQKFRSIAEIKNLNKFTMVKPIKVTASVKYKIHVVFEDGLTGEADLSDSAGKGVFKYWDVGNNFQNVFVNSQTYGIAWNEELEIDPETVYKQLKSAVEEHV